MQTYPIDFVVPWVNPNDPQWQDSFNTFSKDAGIYTDSSTSRYRDWGLFKYWFRGVEKYAPWVNKIHLITAGHYPEWLNLDHPKLNFVKHSDYIPSQHLPTFSANPIEINIHRIESLSEHFVYFNDDIFIKSPLKKDWFFKNGLPCDASVLTAFSGSGFTRFVINSNIVINKHNEKFESMKSQPLKWINPKYGPNLLRTFLLMPWREFTGFYDYHLANAYLKSTFEEVWSREEKMLTETSSRKFRHSLDLNQSVFRNWQLATNNFSPISKHKLGDNCSLGVQPIDQILKKFSSEKKPLICLNDSADGLEDINATMLKIQHAFEKKFPNKSSFEV